LNCGKPVSGNYCSDCGQKTIVKRYSFNNFFSDLYNSIIEFDFNYLRTFNSLLLKPGVFIKNYLFGKRRKYVSPIKYLIIILALNFAVTFFLNRPAFEPVKIYTDDKSLILNQAITLLTNIITIVLMLPFAAGIKLINRKEDFSLMEYFIFMIYIVTQAIGLYILIQILLKIFSIEITENLRGISWLIVFSLMYGWGYFTFFKEKKFFFRMILSYITGILLLIIPVYLIGIILKNMF